MGGVVRGGEGGDGRWKQMHVERMPSCVENDNTYNIHPTQLTTLTSPHNYRYTHRHTSTQTQAHTLQTHPSTPTHLIEVKDQVQLTDVAEELVQHFHKVVDGLEITKVVVFQVQAETEVQAGIAPIDNLEITKLLGARECGVSEKLELPDNKIINTTHH